MIMHSLGPGYYYEIDGITLTEKDISDIKNAIRNEIEKNKEIARGKLNYLEAIDILKKDQKTEKLKLFNTINPSTITCYRCDDFYEMIDTPLAISTGVVKVFDVINYSQGFILQFPKRSNLNEVSPFLEQKRIFEVYQEHKNLGKALKVDNVGALNDIIINRQINDFIQIEEALQERQITGLATSIYQKRDSVRLVAIAGPSSSGKTTFSKRLSLQLRAYGLNPVTISVDNYFVDRIKTPLDADGKLDYESINAINLELFNDHLKALLAGKEINTAYYDFRTGFSSISNNRIKLNNNDIIVIEGIHGLNDKLTFSIDKSVKFKIYISALTQMNIDDVNRIPTTDNRVLRRLVRDYRYRGHSGLTTLKMWPSVRRGEEQNIFPYQNNADGYFNSALDYELSVLKPYAQTILMQVKPDVEEYAEAVRLLNFLKYFHTIPADNVPQISILREFIGGSGFKY